MELKEKYLSVKKDFESKLSDAKSLDDLENIRLEFLSRSGKVSDLMHQMRSLIAEDKKTIGPLLNQFKNESLESFNLKKEELSQSAQIKFDSKLDESAYIPNQIHGHLHPYTHVLEQLENVFISMGYQIVDGPELEDDFHNFQALNIPENHPARDMQDTFWLKLPGQLMRTQTSTVQIRTMKKSKPPLAILSIGRCYRNEATDASHDFVFRQAEGLFIGKDVSMANLFATVKTFLQAVFEKDELEIRVRPSYFPFVEPGVEIDMQCPFCENGCSVCGHSRWIEIMGAGLVHPNVLQACNIDSKVYTGFAFGVGLTRLVMLKYGINDIRLLSSSKLDFLRQFP